MILALLRMMIFAGILACVSPVAAQVSDAGLRGHGGPIRAIAVLGGGRVVTAGFDGAIIIWDVNAGRAERVLRFHDSAVNALVVRADGCLVLAGDDAKIAVCVRGRKHTARDIDWSQRAGVGIGRRFRQAFRRRL